MGLGGDGTIYIICKSVPAIANHAENISENPCQSVANSISFISICSPVDLHRVAVFNFPGIILQKTGDSHG